MSSHKIRKLVLSGVIAGLLVVVYFSQRHLNTQREVMGLTRIAPLENAPPMLAFTTKALGSFRGLIANALWIRATEMQENGKYFEMVQLADWITKLEPKLTAVWIHQAWNMAYNISVKFNDHHDRWLWVRRGTELLRDVKGGEHPLGKRHRNLIQDAGIIHPAGVRVHRNDPVFLNDLLKRAGGQTQDENADAAKGRDRE